MSTAPATAEALPEAIARLVDAIAVMLAHDHHAAENPAPALPNAAPIGCDAGQPTPRTPRRDRK